MWEMFSYLNGLTLFSCLHGPALLLFQGCNGLWEFAAVAMSRFATILTSGLLALPVVTASFPDCQSGPEILKNNSVCDTSKAPEVRAAAIIAAMTMEEKMNNTGKYVTESSSSKIEAHLF